MKLNTTQLAIIIILAIITPTQERVKHHKKRTSTKTPSPVIEYAYNFAAVATQDAKSQFFDPAQIKVIFNGSPDGESFESFITKVNAAVPTANQIVLSSDKDLTIKQIGIYKRPFILGFVHELLSICATNSASPEKFYNFIFHRGSKNGTKDMSTAVRITIYDTANGASGCKPAHTIDPNSALRQNNKKGLESTDIKIQSFKVFFEMSRQYAVTYPEYKANKQNCQHFATGFYNAVTNGEIIGTSNLFSNAPQYKIFKGIIDKLLQDYVDSRAIVSDDDDLNSCDRNPIPEPLFFRAGNIQKRKAKRLRKN